MDARESCDVATNPNEEVAVVFPDGENEPNEANILWIPKNLFRPTYAQVPAGLSIEAWGGLLARTGTISNATPWWMGDLMLHGENAYGESHTQYLPDDEHSIATLTAARWVASRIPPERRRPELSWSIHKEVASCEPADQDKYLDLAQAEGLSVRHLRERIADKKKRSSSRSPNSQGALAYSGQRTGKTWRVEDHAQLAALLGLDAELDTPIPFDVVTNEDGTE